MGKFCGHCRSPLRKTKNVLQQKCAICNRKKVYFCGSQCLEIHNTNAAGMSPENIERLTSCRKEKLTGKRKCLYCKVGDGIQRGPF